MSKLADRLLIENVSVLVIDDDAMVRSVLIDYLHAFGFKNVVDGKSGRQAQKLIYEAQSHFDLILCDWHMPEVDGLSLLKLCRAIPFRKNAKFIMITSQVPEERIKVAKARAAGVDSYIVKPFRGKLLREKIWSVMGWDPGEDEKAG